MLHADDTPGGGGGCRPSTHLAVCISIRTCSTLAGRPACRWACLPVVAVAADATPPVANEATTGGRAAAAAAGGAQSAY